MIVLKRAHRLREQYRRAATAASTVAKEIETNDRGVKKYEWKLEVIKIMEANYTKRKTVYRTERSRQNAIAEVIRASLKDDIVSLVRLTNNQLRSRNNDQIVCLCLQVLNKQFERLLRRTDAIQSPAALSLFFGIEDLWNNLKRTESYPTYLIALLILSTIRRWMDERTFDSKSAVIADKFDAMEQKIRALAQEVQLEDAELVLSSDDQVRIQKEIERFRKFPVFNKRSKEPARYEIDNPLVASLQSNYPKDEYGSNPFDIEGMSKPFYKTLFDDHLKVESSMWIQVKNTVSPASAGGAFGESLISEWDWEARIKDRLQKIDSNDTHPFVATCLELIPRDKLVKLLYFSAMSACCQGQNLIGASTFQSSVIDPILDELGRTFKSRMGFEEDEIWKKAFDTYIQYFCDSEVSRTNTHREWWVKSCLSHKVSPGYNFDMGHLDESTKDEVGNVLINALFESCIFPSENKLGDISWKRAFSYRSVSIEEKSKLSTDSRLSLSKMLSIDRRLMAMFEKNPFEFIVFSTSNLPLTIPPRPWIDKGTGGPLYTSAQNVVRCMNEYKTIRLNEEMRERIKSPVQARPVFDALNHLGSTPWVINEPLLDVLKNVFGQSGDNESRNLLEALEIPMRHDSFSVPEFVEEFGAGVKKEDVPIDQFRSYAKRKAEAIKMKNESNSLWCWMLYRVVLADHFRGKTLFFPHNMDFRGRVYPISPYLSHMGDDINRCILKFAKSQPLGDRGFDWLKLHCVNLTGSMKRASIADRMAEADRLLPLMLDSARNPLGGDKWWMKSDEPWQTLAACKEIESAHSYGSDVALFPSQLPIHQDGSCNGLQHYAALGKDNDGGVLVNLTKSDLPNDVYSDVAQRVEQKRRQDEETNNEDSVVAKRLREALPQDVPRKVIKQTVMTTVYGVTMYGAVMQIKRQLKALDIPGDDAALFARYLARKTFASLNDAFTSSMALKDWFRLIAKGTSDLMQTVEWVTPLGLPVVQPYCKTAERRGKMVIAPVPMKQVDAFPPNFVHSLDSTHMMLTSLNCAKRGITFAAVHDCFWTHASSVDEMNEICRQQFVSLHSQPIVQQCSDWFKETYLTPTVRKILPVEVLEKFNDTFTSKVKPGKLDIEQVKDSVYFFS